MPWFQKELLLNSQKQDAQNSEGKWWTTQSSQCNNKAQQRTHEQELCQILS